MAPLLPLNLFKENNMLRYFKPLIPFLAGWALLLISANFSHISLINGFAQLILFALVVCWPAWKTGRLSYVDIGWPLGLVVIGIVNLCLNDGYWVRNLGVSLVYLFVGLRMGGGALRMWQLGMLKKEFPRYQYQRLRWQKSGKDNLPLAIQVEALVQGIANASFLAFPAFIIGANTQTEISIFEIIGLILWLVAFALESTADSQKQKFLREMKVLGERNRVCNVGLWRYSRHPNYFSEWMVWNALIIAAIPSWLALQSSTPIAIWALLGLGLLFASRMMYTTLVYYTGAVPSEFYSVQKRPEYKHYQQTTNIFFPGPVKKTK